VGVGFATRLVDLRPRERLEDEIDALGAELPQ
jgi:hypothetical protein